MFDQVPSNPAALSFRGDDVLSLGAGFVHFEHRLADSGLFSDERLAGLIERYPGEYAMVTTTVGTDDRPEWRNGALGGLPGAFVLEAVRRGRLWINLRRLDLVAPEYDALINDAFAAAERMNPGLHTFRRKSSILISSPSARVLYHADIPMVALWHVRGRKRVWLYDAASREHLPDQVLESVILRETEEEIPYDPQWDNDAVVVDLEPGFALSWPQNAPHRVDNLEGLNVSVTTDFYTPAAQRKYGVYFANGVIRRRLGIAPGSTAISGPGALARCALAAAIKKLGIRKGHERTLLKSFELDPSEPGRLVHLDRSAWTPITQV